MRRTELLAVVLPLALTGILAGCTLGEPVLPNPTPGRTASQEIGTVVPVPDPIPHSLEGREQCFTCHAIGAVEAPPVPTDHEQDVEQCTTCHAVWTRPGIAAAAAPAIRHELEGRDDCLMCHKMGTAGAPRVPENHSGLPSSICRSCHLAGEEVIGGKVEAVTAALAIPHGLEGFAACTLCHEKGGPGVPRFPADHAGRTDDVCTACHRAAAPTSTPTVTPSEGPSAAPAEAPPAPGDAASGQVLYAANCALCHGANGEGTAIAPEPLNSAEFLAEHSDDEIAQVIRVGEPGKMPPMSKLSEQEILDLIAFIRNWP